MKSKRVVVSLGGALCSQLSVSGQREWLVTNGLGSYASGTVCGAHTRRYHGLLVTALAPPLGRTLMVSKLEETLTYGAVSYELACNRWGDGTIAPRGFQLIESYVLDGSTPVWRYACADALLEKRIWMENGANTTYVHYHLIRASAAVELHIKGLVGYRDHHHTTRANDWYMQVENVNRGVQVTAHAEATPYWLLCSRGTCQAEHVWYRNLSLPRESERGLEDRDDILHAATFSADLAPGETLTVVASTHGEMAHELADDEFDGGKAYLRRRSYENELLSRASTVNIGDTVDTMDTTGVLEPVVRQLILAAEQFIVKRPSADQPDGMSIIAGYPWFGDWGRDTMIALPGLTLATFVFGL
ncbi:MAG: glycogen debranching enzyme N-terminal domain-containing protein, partial [Myxococcota bacterium]